MMSTFCTLQDFYLALLLEQVLEQKHLCGWSTSGVLLEPVLWLSSPSRNPGSALQRAPKQERSGGVTWANCFKTLFPILFGILRFLYPKLS